MRVAEAILADRRNKNDTVGVDCRSQALGAARREAVASEHNTDDTWSCKIALRLHPRADRSGRREIARPAQVKEDVQRGATKGRRSTPRRRSNALPAIAL